MTLLKISGIVTLLVGVICLVLEILKTRRCSLKTTGILIDVEERYEKVSSREGRNYYVPYFEYEVDGQKHVVQGNTYSTNAAYFKSGLTTSIRYSPNDPKDCIVGEKRERTIIGCLMIIVGVFLVVFG